MHSALYIGWVSHRRREPARHDFRYRSRMLWIDLAELSTLFRGRWLWSVNRGNLAWFRRRDYLGSPEVPLDVAVRDCVADELGLRPVGPIRMLTHIRLYGLNFNPVTFYYCYAEDGQRLQAIVAEITNTPWQERFRYVIPATGVLPGSPVVRASLQKRFHVSPFMPMDMEYEWSFSMPGDALTVVMVNKLRGRVVFDAMLQLQRRELSGLRMASHLLHASASGAVQLARIYWQALRLWVRGTSVHPHPRSAP